MAAQRYLIYDSFRLCPVRSRIAAVKCTLDHFKSYHRIAVIRRRECIEFSFVEELVRESDEALVTASVVPEQVELRHADCEAVVKNALKVFNFIVLVIKDLLPEERGRRHLLGVAYDNGILTSCYDADRLTCRQL